MEKFKEGYYWIGYKGNAFIEWINSTQELNGFEQIEYWKKL